MTSTILWFEKFPICSLTEMEIKGQLSPIDQIIWLEKKVEISYHKNPSIFLFFPVSYSPPHWLLPKCKSKKIK